MKFLPTRRAWALGLAAVVFVAGGAWCFRQVVPAGLRLRSVEPFFFWSYDLGAFPSPQGTNQVRVIVNDAGAMHSGNHWVWVVTSSRLGGRRVVAEGYIDREDLHRERLPLRWLSESEIEMRFRQGRRSRVEVAGTYLAER